jgi:hypothetical protein
MHGFDVVHAAVRCIRSEIYSNCYMASVLESIIALARLYVHAPEK